jgi:hypothetical protein
MKRYPRVARALSISNDDWGRWQSGTFSAGRCDVNFTNHRQKFRAIVFDGTDIAKHKHCQITIRAQWWQK